MYEASLVELKWPEVKNMVNTFFIEKGYIQDETDDQILFLSLEDGSLNWVDKKYIK
jgi:hypothetical protein